MALWSKCDGGLGLGLVRSHSFGRKRVVLSAMESDDFLSTTPPKKHCPEVSFPICQKSVLEALPQDVLIRIVCGVDHDDLKRLFHVSKAIREATLIAKDWHFEYSTPRKTIGFKSPIDFEDLGEFNEVEAPNAPRQSRVPRSRVSRKKLAGLSIALFASDDEEDWRSRESYLQMEAEL
nr:F-box protein At1g61340-like [Ipomoea batatas]